MTDETPKDEISTDHDAARPVDRLVMPETIYMRNDGDDDIGMTSSDDPSDVEYVRKDKTCKQPIRPKSGHKHYWQLSLDGITYVCACRAWK